MKEDLDADLLALVACGDEAAFRTLIARKLEMVHRLAVGMLGDASLADDVAQEAFLRIWRQAAEWEPGRANFDTWLNRVVRNLCLDRLRQRRLVFYSDPPDQVDPALSADMKMSQSESARRIQEALARLPRRQHDALILQIWEELSNVEIANTMGISVRALESLLVRARRALRAILEEAGV